MCGYSSSWMVEGSSWGRVPYIALGPKLQVLNPNYARLLG
jgi:hypothetical protein